MTGTGGETGEAGLATRSAPFGFGDRGARFEIVGSATDPVLNTLDVDDGVYEEHLMRLFPRVVSPGAVVVDAGAHIGVHTVLLAHLASSGRVYAFEPAAQSHRFLVDNVERNGLTNVVATHVALGDSPGTTTLSFDPRWPAGAFVAEHFSEHETESVERVRLDDWLEEHGVERVDVIKLDVEGSELRVLDGAQRTLERTRPRLVVECNPLSIQRVERRRPEELWHRLHELYPTIAYVTGRGGLVPIGSWDHLARLLARRGIVDLYCAPEALGVGDRARGFGHGALLAAFHNRWRPPRSAVVFEPRYRLHLDADELELTLGETVELPGLLENDGATWLSSTFTQGEVLLAYHWLRADGSMALFEGERTRLPRAVAPGGAVEVVLKVVGPEEPGEYVLEVSLLQDRWAWAHHLDPTLAVRIPTRVTTRAT